MDREWIAQPEAIELIHMLLTREEQLLLQSSMPHYQRCPLLGQ